MPCTSANISLYFARKSKIPLISTSLNVVNIAAVCCAETRRSAMRVRIWLIGSRRSLSLEEARAGAETFCDFCAFCGSSSVSETGGSDAADSRYASTSSLVNRPSFPVPVIAVGSRSCSVTNRRTAGLKPSASTGVSTFSDTSTFETALPSSSIVAMVSPTSIVSPSAFSVCNTPAEGAGNSTSALSVSITAKGSSTVTASPSDFNHSTRMASVTDSPNSGKTTSTGMYAPP